MVSEPIARATRSAPTTSLMVIGAALLPLGVIVIGLGWYGVSHSSFVFEQNSYLISGGLFGLGLVLVGGFLYFGGWIARLSESTKAENDRLIAAIEALVASPGGVSAAAGAGMAARLVATKTGSMYHRPDCSVVAHHSDVRTVTGEEGGMKPCRLCDPLGANH
jgi:hypothetical protein